MATELIHAGHHNVNGFLLLADGVVMTDASAITRMVLTLTPASGSDDVVVDSDINAAAFNWSGTTAYKGAMVALLVLALGLLAIAKGRYQGTLVIYSIDYPNGLVWATGIDFRVIS